MKQRLLVTMGVLVFLLMSLLIIKNISTEEEPIKESNPPIEEVLPKEEPLEEPEIIIPEIEEPIIEEPEVEKIPNAQEQMRAVLVEKYGEEAVSAWEKLTVDPNFNFVGKRLVVEELYGPNGEIYYECYVTMEDGSETWAGVGGNYYVYGVFISTEALIDLVEYHNTFSIIQ